MWNFHQLFLSSVVVPGNIGRLLTEKVSPLPLPSLDFLIVKVRQPHSTAIALEPQCNQIELYFRDNPGVLQGCCGVLQYPWAVIKVSLLDMEWTRIADRKTNAC